MIDRKHRLTSLAVTLALAALNLIALNFLVSGWSTARLDLTEERLFSISPATKRLLAGVDESLTIYGYFSRRTHPKLSPLIPCKLLVLEKYVKMFEPLKFVKEDDVKKMINDKLKK